MHPGTAATDGHFVHANGLDIYYRDLGAGEPLLLHCGTVSKSTVWDDH